MLGASTGAVGIEIMVVSVDSVISFSLGYSVGDSLRVIGVSLGVSLTSAIDPEYVFV